MICFIIKHRMKRYGWTRNSIHNKMYFYTQGDTRKILRYNVIWHMKSDNGQDKTEDVEKISGFKFKCGDEG